MSIEVGFSLVVALFLGWIGYRQVESKRREQRIGRFLDRFGQEKGRRKYMVQCVLPAGINELKTCREVTEALHKIELTYGKNPFQNYLNQLKKRQYKKFFEFAAGYKHGVTSKTIQPLIDGFKNNKTYPKLKELDNYVPLKII